MTIDELLQEIKQLNNSKKLPKYIETTDISESKVEINSKWQNVLYSWGICKKDDKYIYFVTDDEQGYIWYSKTFSNEEDAVQYAHKQLIIKYKSLIGETVQELRQLYNRIKNANDENTNNTKLILDILFKEKEKNPNKEFVSLKDAIRVYLEGSNDYDNIYFTKICEVQEILENYYDEKLKKYIKNNSSLPKQGIERMIKNLKSHSDLYAEIVDYILADNTYRRPLISALGYDANRLCAEFNLTIVGAYNFIIYLREDPKNALADLKAGLPRK